MKVIVANETSSILPIKFDDKVDEKVLHIRKGAHADYLFQDGDDLLVIVKSDEVWVVSAGRQKNHLK